MQASVETASFKEPSSFSSCTYIYTTLTEHSHTAELGKRVWEMWGFVRHFASLNGVNVLLLGKSGKMNTD